MVGMMVPPSPELACVGYRITAKEQLKDIPSNELEIIVKDLLTKRGEEPINFYLMAMRPNHDVFLYAGAIDVLKERHGQDYVDRLLNLRRPRTFGERLRALIFNDVFVYDN